MKASHLKYRAPKARIYLKSSFRINSRTMSFSGCSCSILSSRHMKLVGLRLPPYVPPMYLTATTLSNIVSAVNPKLMHELNHTFDVIQRTIRNGEFSDG
jgi:hypothetical protein